MHHKLILVAAAAASLALGQTEVDLRTQSKSVDFSAASITKPMSVGGTLPSICTAGQMFFLLSAQAGLNVYACVSTNIWSLEGGSGSGLPPVTGHGGNVLTTDGTNVLWKPFGGDISGAPGNVTVTQIQGFAVSAAAPGAGQTLIWSAANDRWEPQPSGGGGVLLSSQLTDFGVVRTAGTTLSLGENCALPTPCNVRFGSTTYTFAAPATVTLNGGTGLAYFYVTSVGSLVAGSTLNLSCTSPCVVQNGVTAFPPGSIPLFTAAATSGTWNTNGITDQRAFLSVRDVGTLAGLTSTDAGGVTTLGVDSTVVSLRTATPPTSSSPCNAGNWATDGSFYYLCIATNQWKRTALSSW